ncbi:MAG: hypothetical protein WA667_21695 [Candidatus Nitrosopolaris sp.]
MRRQRIDFCILVLAVLTIIPALLYSTNSYLIQKTLAQNNVKNTVKTSSATPSIESLYTSFTDPKTSSQNSSNLNKGVGTVTPPTNPANTGESLIGSFLSPKVLLSSAIDQIRNSTTSSVRSTESHRNSTLVVWDYDTLLLSRQIIPPKDFMPLFDALSYEVMDGHVSAKLPCNANSTSPLKIFIAKIGVGQTPEITPVHLQLVNELSKPAYMCVYHADLPSTSATRTSGPNETKGNNTYTAKSVAVDNLTITDIELLNPTNSQVVLPDTSSIAIGLNEIIPSDHDYQYNST